jgi:hypothetical protein
MLLQLLATQGVAFIIEGHHRPELIRPDLVQADSDAQLQRRPEIERATQQ